MSLIKREVMAKLRQLSCRMCQAVKSDNKENYIVLFRIQSVEADRKSYKTVSVPKGRSNPDGAVAQLARAPALQAGCRGFEPLRLHQIFFGYKRPYSQI